ncbi:FACT complex subunit SSRP1, partial [Mucuna pruriens]
MNFSKIVNSYFDCKKTNGGISFTDERRRVVGEKCEAWLVANCFISFMQFHRAKARADNKIRSKDDHSGYKNPQPMNIDSRNESDSALG